MDPFISSSYDVKAKTLSLEQEQLHLHPMVRTVDPEEAPYVVIQARKTKGAPREYFYENLPSGNLNCNWNLMDSLNKCNEL